MRGGNGNSGRFLAGLFEFQASLPLSVKVPLAVAAWILLLAIWQFAPRPESMVALLPTPVQVGETLATLVTEKDFTSDVAASLQRILISFGIAAAIALPLGILMGAFPVVEAFFNPLVSPLRYLPAPSFIPLLLALLGTGDEQKIALLVIGVVWFLISLIMDDTKRVSKDLIEASRTLGATRPQVIFAVILPAALPFFVDTMRQMLAVSWTYLVIAEIVAATDGIGAVMMRARRLVRMDIILACILTIGALGLISDTVIRSLRWAAFPYLRGTRQ
ncbi:MAG: ABC transporter permease [Terrimicrobiaceae bacterium]|nr:ABC transporter permease [Terrimicrobiaceae bacterium]